MTSPFALWFGGAAAPALRRKLLGDWIRELLIDIPDLNSQVYPTLGSVDAAPPYAVYGVISAVGLTVVDTPDSELDSGVFQVSFYGRSYRESWELSALARRALLDNSPATLGIGDITANDLGREVETGLYHVSLRVTYSYIPTEVS